MTTAADNATAIRATDSTSPLPGVHHAVPRDQMERAAQRLHDLYTRKPGAPLIQREFGFYCMDAWKERDGLPPDADLSELFGYETFARHGLGQLGWCEAALQPVFETKVLEDRGDHEVVQDYAGRHVLFFKSRRSGFMPEYLVHPVKDKKSWEEQIAWRLDPTTEARYTELPARMAAAQAQAARGWMICQNLIGGYMYLRSLIGPGDLLYVFYDQPELVHACMQAWFELADAVIARHQEYVTIDELFLAEDICYNHGPLISPEMMRTFLLPYYQQLITNLRRRQIDQQRHLYIQIDTDGLATPTIPIYQELGMDVMSPFEVASGCDVVEIGRHYPDLVMLGGIDKRILAKGKAAIDAHLDHILPVMHARGGYCPTCDHGVPEEVRLDDYKHYRQRVLAYA